MIEINGLTKKQVAMLDILWSLQGQDEIVVWISTLSDEDQTMALALLKLLHAEMIDQYIDDTSLEEARSVIEKIQKNL